MPNIPPRRFAQRAVCLSIAFLTAPAALAQTEESADARIRKLEERLETTTRQMNEALDALRRELDDARRAAARATEAAARPAKPEAATVDAAKATADVKAELLETREQVNALQSRLDQQGVQVRFTDGVIFEDPRGQWSVRLSGRAQLDYRHFIDGNDLDANTFSLRRARLGATVTLLRDYLVTVEGEFASGETSTSATTGTPPAVGAQSSQMTLGFLEYQRWPQARLRMGQFKPQFGLEQTLLDLQSDFMERAQTQSILDGNNINYDRGIMVHGAPVQNLYYALAVTNGNGQNRDERQATTQDARSDGKDVTARLVYNFAPLFTLQDAVLHFGGSFKSGTLTNSSGTPFAPPSFRTEARGLVFFSPEALNGQTGVAATSVKRRIMAAEASFAWQSVRLTGEWWLAEYSGSRTAPGAEASYDKQIQASYVSLLWLATGEQWSDAYSGGYWQKVRPNNRFNPGADGGWGAIELGLRYSRFDASDFIPATLGAAATGRYSAGNPLTVGTNRASSVTLQLKWIHNTFSRMLIDYVRTSFDTPVAAANGTATDRETAIMTRYQIDF